MSNSRRPGYRPCVGITVINPAGLVWVGRRADAGGDEEGRGPGGRCPRAASMPAKPEPTRRCAS